MKTCALLMIMFSLSAAASEESFNLFDVVHCSTSSGVLVGQIVSLGSDISADVAWMNGETMSTDFNLKKSCVNITNWSNKN